MRRDALRLDQRQVFKEKFARLDTDLFEKCAEKRNKVFLNFLIFKDRTNFWWSLVCVCFCLKTGL